jgi:uracil phosphoribosyltransferase
MTILKHPLIADRLTSLRNKDSNSQEFRSFLRNIATLMVAEVTADLETTAQGVETPIEETEGRRISMPVVLVPVLRAGLSLAEGFLTAIPEAKVAHIGIRRNHTTLKPEVYYPNPPVDFANSNTIVLDPMLATGGTAIETIRILKKQGAKRLIFTCVIAAPEGLQALQSAHPGLPIYVAAVDRCLDENGYICPGLGDAGDRSFGTA